MIDSIFNNNSLILKYLKNKQIEIKEITVNRFNKQNVFGDYI